MAGWKLSFEAKGVTEITAVVSRIRGRGKCDGMGLLLLKGEERSLKAV